MKALVTGGGGFLGGAIARLLRARGDEVRTVSRGDYPWLRTLGAMTCRADLTQGVPDDAIAGCDVVFHVAARAGVWGNYAAYHAANVEATRQVIEACRRHGVRRLIFTSSPSVVFTGRSQQNVDESAPYPERYLSHYPRTKAIAERLVLAANDATLATVSLRPHLIWGPGDPHLVPRVLERGRSGHLRVVGRRENLVDSVYIDNAAAAHLLAADRLAPGSTITGRIYFITNDQPLPMAELLNRILAAGHLPPVTRHISAATAYAAGAVFEAIYALLRREDEPPMTRFVARQLATAHWFNIEAARRDLGYVPRVSIADGMRRLEQSLHGGAQS